MKEDEKTERLQPMSFAEHKEVTLADLRAVVKQLEDLATAVQEGDMGAFERFWLEGGTEEGDAKIIAVREMIILRYFYRQERVAV